VAFDLIAMELTGGTTAREAGKKWLGFAANRILSGVKHLSGAQPVQASTAAPERFARVTVGETYNKASQTVAFGVGRARGA
jgi:hypothetical protein